jgi:hypothetical protein
MNICCHELPTNPQNPAPTTNPSLFIGFQHVSTIHSIVSGAAEFPDTPTPTWASWIIGTSSMSARLQYEASETVTGRLKMAEISKSLPEHSV